MRDFKDLPEYLPNVYEIRPFYSVGPWSTKSKGLLNVFFSIPFNVIQKKFLQYSASELQKISEDIRGFRMYMVKDLQSGNTGGQEYHRVRQEIIFGLTGTTFWRFEDLFGQEKEFKLTPGFGLWIPPFIIHTYNVMENCSSLLVLANTLYDANKEETYDTYSVKSFRELQGALNTIVPLFHTPSL